MNTGLASRNHSRRTAARIWRWTLPSVVLHVGAALLLVPTASEQLDVVEVTEVDLVDRPAKRETTRPRTTRPQKRREKKKATIARQRRPRSRRAPRRPPPAPVQPPPAPDRASEEVSDLLSMRPEPAPPPDPPVPEPDRFASFWVGRDSAARRPRTVSRIAVGGIEEERHHDGGRVLRSTREGAEPTRGAVGLVRLAGSRLGTSDGYQACDPYRGFRGRGRGSRHLIMLVDTSSSVVLTRHAPNTIICAAGAALSALQRGFDVTVINFSSISYRYGPTHDIEVVYDALSFQAQGTVLPEEALRDLDVGDPWDLVLITDAAIQNLEKTLPGYATTLKARVGLRAMLFYLGNDALDGVAMLQQIGFRPRYVEGSL
jgi:hypothetical protein